MIIGAGLDARLGLSFGELREAGAMAARLGFESLWTPAGGIPDAFHVCAAWSTASAEATGDPARTGISVVPAPRLWTVESLAMQAATVGLISGGRFVLGIGTGGATIPNFAAVGLARRPLAVIKDYLVILRGLLAGDEVTYAGPALNVSGLRLGPGWPVVPVYLAALGPQMLRLAGAHADGASLNWASPEQIAWSRDLVSDGARAQGRDPAGVDLSMYIRVCVDDDVDAARRAFAGQVLGYALGRPGADPTLAYRGHFARMGFDAVLRDLEARRDQGAVVDELIDHVPDELLATVGYYGPAEGAASRLAALSVGLDEAIVRVITARPGLAPVAATLEALTPAKIRAAQKGQDK
jgi:alkanesulfonate monooxygenase SsuD/methylene tetrahydromethanopterin reductase-like flavin-dependent oxidoreductase (luciferase family)